MGYPLFFLLEGVHSNKTIKSIFFLDGEMDDDGFFMGELNGRRGLVPSNFLTDVPSGYIFMDQNQQGFPYASNRPSNQQPRILGTQRRW